MVSSAKIQLHEPRRRTHIARQPFDLREIYGQGLLRGAFDPGSTEFLRFFDFYSKQGGLLEVVVGKSTIKTVEVLLSNPLVLLSVVVLFPLQLMYLSCMRSALPRTDLGHCGFRAGARSEDFPGPRIVASRSMFFPDTEDMMAWRLADSGFQIVLSAGVPDLVRNSLRQGVDSFLADHSLSRNDISHWIAHTGGPKVLQAIEATLEVPRCALARSWKSLAALGNLSSASVLFVAADFMDSNTSASRRLWGPPLDGSRILRRIASAAMVTLNG